MMLLLGILACVHKPPAPAPAPAPSGPRLSGTASWYGEAFNGRPTASGVPFQASKLTAAHRTLPFGTIVRVTRSDTGAQVTVVINDRGPWTGGRVLDVSEAAAKKLGMVDSGTAPVKITVVGCDDAYDTCR